MVRVVGIEPTFLAEPGFEPFRMGYAPLRSSALE